jgi:hypothetical protein
MHVLSDGSVVGESLWRKLLFVATVPDLEPRWCSVCQRWGHLPEAHVKGKYKIERN